MGSVALPFNSSQRCLNCSLRIGTTASATIFRSKASNFQDFVNNCSSLCGVQFGEAEQTRQQVTLRGKRCLHAFNRRDFHLCDQTSALPLSWEIPFDANISPPRLGFEQSRRSGLSFQFCCSAQPWFAQPLLVTSVLPFSSLNAAALQALFHCPLSAHSQLAPSHQPSLPGPRFLLHQRTFRALSGIHI